MPMEIHNLSMNWKVPSEPYVEDYCRRTAANVTPTVPARVLSSGGGRGEASPPNTPTSPSNIQASPPVRVACICLQ